MPAYQKHFTKGDMDALIAFYSAPTGQKLLQELPSVMAESMESMMPIMRKSVDRMTQSVEEEIAQNAKGCLKQSARCSRGTKLTGRFPGQSLPQQLATGPQEALSAC